MCVVYVCCVQPSPTTFAMLLPGPARYACILRVVMGGGWLLRGHFCGGDSTPGGLAKTVKRRSSKAQAAHTRRLSLPSRAGATSPATSLSQATSRLQRKSRHAAKQGLKKKPKFRNMQRGLHKAATLPPTCPAQTETGGGRFLPPSRAPSCRRPLPTRAAGGFLLLQRSPIGADFPPRQQPPKLPTAEANSPVLESD